MSKGFAELRSRNKSDTIEFFIAHDFAGIPSPSSEADTVEFFIDQYFAGIPSPSSKVAPMLRFQSPPKCWPYRVLSTDLCLPSYICWPSCIELDPLTFIWQILYCHEFCHDYAGFLTASPVDALVPTSLSCSLLKTLPGLHWDLNGQPRSRTETDAFDFSIARAMPWALRFMMSPTFLSLQYIVFFFTKSWLQRWLRQLVICQMGPKSYIFFNTI